MKALFKSLPLLVAALGTSHAQLAVSADHDFADNAIPAAFTTSFGAGPATGGGVLTFDGTTAIQAPTSTIYGTAPTDNYGYEVIVTPSALDAFDLIVSIVDSGAGNNGSIIYRQPNYGLLEAGEGAIQGPTAAAIGTTVALAFVMDGGTGRLYVNGSEETSRVFTPTGPTPVPALNTVVIGSNLFDGAAGAFNGTVDRYRAFSFAAGTFNAADLLGPGDGTAPVGVPTLTAAMVNDLSVTETGADASAELGGTAADVTLFWAETDYGTNLTDWQTNGSSSALGNQAIGTVNGSLSGLTGDTTYTARFYAVNTTPDPDDEAWSAAVTFGTPFATGQKVTDLAATAISFDQIDLTWSDAFNTEEEYYLETSEDAGLNWFPLATLPPNTTSYSDLTVSELTTYQYRILASSTASGDSDWSNVAEETTPAEPPFTPTVAGDYTFDDNQAPSGFTEFGDPTYADGELLLDGDGDYIQAAAPTTATDNVILEAIVTADAVGTFNFAASISDAGLLNSGYGIVAQNGNWNALTSGIGFSGTEAHGTTPTPAVAVAFVREKGNSSLYVNGILFDNGGADGAITLNDAGVITIGGHKFDAPNGLFNGSIDRVRVSTFIGPFDPAYLLDAPAPTNDFANWIAGFSVGGLTAFDDDFDQDGLANGLENFLGTDPGAWNAGLTQVSSNGSGTTFQHPQNASPASDVAGSYEWSTDLENWNNSGDEVGGTTVIITASPDDPVAGTTTVTAAASGTMPSGLFVRLRTTQTM